MEFTIREMSWFKRRLPTDEPKPVDVAFTDLQLIENHRCDMKVTYDNGEIFTLTGRVNQNPIKKTWTVHGIDYCGHQCMVDIKE